MTPKRLFTGALVVLIGLALLLTIQHFGHELSNLGLLAMALPLAAPMGMATISDSQMREWQRIMEGLKSYGDLMEELPGRLEGYEANIKELGEGFRKLQQENSKLRRMSSNAGTGVRWVGNVPFVTDECAMAMTSVFVLECANMQKVGGCALDVLVSDKGARERVIGLAKNTLGIEARTAMTGTEIPLPTIYVPQVVELVFRYGTARQYATVMPLGAGTAKLPRLKAGEDDFGYLGAGTAGMSQTVNEKRVTAELVTFTANKLGGIIRIPYELEEDTFIPIGQFLARYIARQFAKQEDKTLFLADGTGTYAGQTGVGPYCATNTDYLLQLAATKTKPSDITESDIRNLRTKVSGAILSGGFDAAYYMHPTFEPLLRSFNKYPNFVLFENQNGKPTWEGWPIRWTGPTQAYTTSAAAGTYCIFFGDLSYWYLGERGQPRLDISREVYFTTDEIALRALERIDVECVGIDSMASLKTAAA